MKYSVSTTKKFEKSLKRCIKRGLDVNKLKKVIWLMVWEQNDTALTLLFIDTGSHADLFG